MTTQIKTRCDHCGQALGVPESQFGESIVCPMCEKAFVVSSVHFSGTNGQQPADSKLDAAVAAGVDNRIEPSPPAGESRETVGRFEILSRLGGGTYGVVYHAYDPVLDREVALKIPRLEAGESEAHVARRFESEAKAAARLRHPGIVAIFETGNTGEQYYIASEYVEGATLRSRIEAGVPPFSVTARWVTAMARAIDYAHSEGIVHRDLKPENVLLDLHERPQILDFGLAKRLGENSSLTTEGSLLGTPAYMSPEQARGEVRNVGPASDQYSLGTMLFELLTGQKPFHGAPHAVVAQVAADDPPPPRSLKPDIPLDLEAICRQAMEKDPARRYRNCGELADDLDRWLSGRETIARPLGLVEQVIRWSRRRPAAAGWSAVFAATFLVAFSLIAWQWQRAERLRSEADANFIDAQDMRTAAEKNALALKRQRDIAKQRAEELVRQRNELIVKEQALTEALARAEHNLAEANRQKQRADATTLLADQASEEAAVNLAKANEQQQRAQDLLAGDYVDLGLKLCEEGRLPAGMLWLARSLSMVPENHPQEHLIRSSLAVYRGEFHQLLSVIEHKSPVVSATSLAGSRLLLTGCADGSVHLWDSVAQAEIIEPLQFEGTVTVTASSASGKLIFIGTDKSVAQVLDLETGKAIGKEFKHPAAVLSAAFSPDGKLLVTGCADRRARIWGTKQGRLITAPLEHQGEIVAVAFSPDGERILTGTAGVKNQLTLWKATHGHSIGVLGTDADPIRCVAFSPDGGWLAAGGDGGGARIWNAKTAQPLPNPCQTGGTVNSLSFSPSGNHLLTGSSDGRVQLWNVADGSPAGQPLQHSSEVRAVAFTEGEKSIAVAGADGRLQVWWNAYAGRSAGALKYSAKVLDVAVSPDGRSLATAGQDRTARVWDLPTGLPVGPPLQHTDAVTSVEFSPDGKYLASGSRDRTARLWDIERSQRVNSRMEHERPLTLVRFSPSGNLLLAVTDGGAAQLWNVSSGKSLRLLQLHRSAIVAAAFRGDGNQLLTGSSDGTARLSNVSSSAGDIPPLKHDGAVKQVAFSPDASQAATASADLTVKVWNPQSGAELRRLQHDAPVTSVTFHPQGGLLLSACADGTAHLWDTRAGTEVRKAIRHASPLLTAEFSRDGFLMLTADVEGEVMVWDAVTGRRIGLPWKLGGRLTQARFTPNGWAVVVVSSTDGVAIRPLAAPVEDPADRIELWTQVVTGHELNESGIAKSLQTADLLERQSRIVDDSETAPAAVDAAAANSEQ